MARERWRFNDQTGEAELVDRFGEPIPEHDIRTISTLVMRGISVISDVETYRSPIDGTVIKSRTDHRDHMKRHGVIELGNEKVGPNTPRQRPPVRDSIERARAKLAQGYRPRLQSADLD